ncbi:unnamed protein product [Nezara viridula]|uniref:Single domain-containing protein n=1 Tax=Nezara viridula TaxID=85310 RepID=A0A9P0H2F2_NEZVI|nr:unnamed protein product [Nezara viridula]
MQTPCLLFICCCIGFATAAVWLEYQKPQPGNTPFCVDKVEGKKKVGEEWQDTSQCVLKRCLTDSQGTPLIHHSSCGAVSAEPPCKVVTPNGTKPYPDCCPMPVC